MIVQVRIDDRLIHGQVALMWSKALDTQGIVVANDGAATNDAIRSTLKMACPSSQKLLVRKLQDAIKVLSDPRGSSMRILVLVNCVKDALVLARGCKDTVSEINVANVGRFNGGDIASKTKLINTVSLTPEELAALRELVSIEGLTVFSQVTPNDQKIDVMTQLKKLG